MFNVSLKKGDESAYSVSDIEDANDIESVMEEKKFRTTLPHRTFHPDNALSPSRKTLRDGTPIYTNSMNIKKVQNRGEFVDEDEIVWIQMPEGPTHDGTAE